MRPSLLPRIAAALLAIQLPVAVVAALVHDDESGDADTEFVEGDVDRDGEADEADADLLARAVEQTATATHYRFEMALDISMPGLESFGGPLGTGERAGDRERFVMDQGELMKVVDGQGADGDYTMEVITEPGAQYLRAPMFAALAEDAEAIGELLPPFMDPLLELGDGWGRIDLDAVGAATGIPSDLTGSSQLDPSDAVAMLRAAVGTERATGTGEVRGVPVTDYDAVITFADLAGGGMDDQTIQSFLPGFAEDFAGADGEEVFDALLEAPLELTASIDDEGLVRRLVVDMRKSFLAMGRALGEDLSEANGLTYREIIEFFDYGDQSIVIDVPPIEETVDLTAWALEMADAFS